MWALVENNAVTQVYTRPVNLELESGNYPRVVFTSYTTEQLEAIGIYEVENNGKIQSAGVSLYLNGLQLAKFVEYKGGVNFDGLDAEYGDFEGFEDD